MDKNYRDAVADGISLLEGKLTPAQFGENFNSGLYNGDQIETMFRYGVKGFIHSNRMGPLEIVEYLNTDEENVYKYLRNDKEINTAIAKSLFFRYTRHTPCSKGLSYDRKFEESSSAVEALGILARGFLHHSENFKFGTAYELYHYPNTLENNPRSEEIRRRRCAWPPIDVNAEFSEKIGSLLKSYAESIGQRIAVLKKLQDKNKASAEQSLHQPEEKILQQTTEVTARPANEEKILQQTTEVTARPANLVSAVWAKLKGLKR